MLRLTDRTSRSWRAPLAVLGAGVLGGCAGAQSALDPAGPEAEAIARLFILMLVAGTLIWCTVIGAYLYARATRRHAWSEPTAARLILWAGAVGPAAALLALLTYALWLMPALRPWAAPAKAGMRVEVTGHQYWWEIVYQPEGGAAVASANEVRLPVGERVEFLLRSPDVIHSFWIPPLGGKMDLIPGRTNRLTLTADRPGIFRGVCAEFCGSAHALMAFDVVAMPPADFRAWLAAQAAPSPGLDAPGRGAFLANGCGACHTVRGTQAVGTIGPTLSHLGSRASIAAGTLPRSAENIARFIADPGAVKPGAAMPAYDMLPPAERAAIAAWLDGLE
jgi:cytochrome c oxidase subunit 2